MRRSILAILILCIIFLSGCDPSEFRYVYDDLIANVESVEWIQYDNQDAIELRNNQKKVKSFDFSKMQIIGTLSEENKNDFLLGVSNLVILRLWRHLDSPKGKGVKINYSDGSFDIICYEARFSCRYDNLGKVKEVIGGSRELH